MAQRLATKRLLKEMTDIKVNGCPPGIEALNVESTDTWIFKISVLGDETIYRGESFALKMIFPERYPIECPIVTFIANTEWQPPLHPHVYSNGHICASILGNEWSPVLTAISICITMQSMLASNKTKVRPTGNDAYVRRAPLNPKETRWQYDDDLIPSDGLSFM